MAQTAHPGAGPSLARPGQPAGPLPPLPRRRGGSRGGGGARLQHTRSHARSHTHTNIYAHVHTDSNSHTTVTTQMLASAQLHTSTNKNTQTHSYAQIHSNTHTHNEILKHTENYLYTNKPAICTPSCKYTQRRLHTLIHSPKHTCTHTSHIHTHSPKHTTDTRICILNTFIYTLIQLTHNYTHTQHIFLSHTHTQANK